MRSRLRATLLLTPLFLLGLAATARSAPNPSAGDLVPAFKLAAAGGTIESDSLRGRVVYVDFWASWCEPCRRSFPWLADLHARYAKKGLVVVAIDLDQERTAADRFLSKYPAPFLVGFDPQGKTAEAFHVDAMPSSFLIDRQGRVLERHAGFDSKKAAEVEKRIAKELEP
jgi:cytochrome c biogenesis protein CcmG/thiol:disulfide interchange protein DsbE